MAKIRIAQNPTFKAKVAIPRVGEKPVDVDFEFKYLDRLALSALFDKWTVERNAHVAKVETGDLSWQDATRDEIALQVSQMKDIVSGWGFADAFSDDAMAALVTACVGASQAVIDAYQSAYQPARLGN